jgi:cytochrome bd-type quinol oxidase subunit 1
LPRQWCLHTSSPPQCCELVGESEMYLHLRVQDAPAAGLYTATGWSEVGRDPWLVRLLGQDQMRLMRKQLTQPLER